MISESLNEKAREAYLVPLLIREKRNFEKI